MTVEGVLSTMDMIPERFPKLPGERMGEPILESVVTKSLRALAEKKSSNEQLEGRLDGVLLARSFWIVYNRGLDGNTEYTGNRCEQPKSGQLGTYLGTCQPRPWHRQVASKLFSQYPGLL